VRAPRALGLATTALLALLAAAGCGSGDDTRFDALPDPIRTVDFAAAAAVEDPPLTEDEWASIEAMHDRYLQDFDAVRRDVLAPLARDVRDARRKNLPDDGTALARLGKRSAAALSRVKSLDDRLASELSDAFRDRAAFIDRVSQRRAIDRSATVIRGRSGDGEDREPTILDLEDTASACGLSLAELRLIEPQLADYRRELARAAAAAAEEWLELPGRYLAMREAAGVGPDALAALRAAAESGESPEAKREASAAAEAAGQECARLLQRASVQRTRAYEAIDAAARRGLEAICAALPPERAAAFRDADERRRVTDLRRLDFTWLVIDAARRHPAVRGGRAPRTEKAIAALREALGRVAATQAELARDDFAARGGGDRAAAADAGDRLRKEWADLESAAEELNRAIAGECVEGDLAQALAGIQGMTPQQAEDRLEPAIGRANAEKVVRRSSRATFRSPRAQEEFEYTDSLSFAEQLLLAPGMDHAAFRRAARALGARDDDPMVEQLWERHQARMAALEQQQRQQLKVLEKDAMDIATHGERAPELEKSIAGYLQALITADNERREADDVLFDEIAIVTSIPRDDARLALARAVSTSRRASLPWRRFRQQWLLGPLCEADSDPLSMALGEGDEVRRTAAVIAMSPFVDRLRETAADTRRAGLEGLRDLLLTGVRASAGGGRLADPSELRDEQEVRAAMERIRRASAERRRVQRQAIESVAAVDPALGTRFLHRWVEDTCPEFFRDGDAWRTADELVASGPPPDRGDGASLLLRAAMERWTIVDDDLARRLSEWQDSDRQEPAARSPADLLRLSALDPALASLRTLRDESAWRLLRIASTAAGRAPDGRMPPEDAGRGLPRPASWTAP
jgi:hypothetical protein